MDGGTLFRLWTFTQLFHHITSQYSSHSISPKIVQIHFQKLSTVILSVANAIGGTKLLIISVPEFTDGSRIQSAPCSSQSGAGPHQPVPERDLPAEHVH